MNLPKLMDLNIYVNCYNEWISEISKNHFHLPPSIVLRFLSILNSLSFHFTVRNFKMRNLIKLNMSRYVNVFRNRHVNVFVNTINRNRYTLTLLQATLSMNYKCPLNNLREFGA